MEDNCYEQTSLCYVQDNWNLNQKNRKWLIRVADITNGKLVQFGPNLEMPTTYENRDRLYYYGTEPQGTWGCWHWVARPREGQPDRDFIEAPTAYRTSIAEVIFQNVQSAKQLVDKLKSGIAVEANSTVVADNILFTISLGKGNYTGIYCKKGNYAKSGNTIKLNDECFSLPMFDFSSHEIINAADHYFYQDTNLDTAEPAHIVIAGDIDDAARAIIRKRFIWSAAKSYGISNSDWKRFTDWLENYPAQSIYEEIATTCKCTIEEAHEQTDAFLSDAQQYMDATDIDSKMLASIIDKHPDWVKEKEHILAERWEKEHANQIDAANQELKAIQTAYEEQRQRMHDLADDERKAHERLRKLSDKEEKQRIIIEKLDDNIRNKLVKAQSDITEFVSTLTFLSTPLLGTPTNSALPNCPTPVSMPQVSQSNAPAERQSPSAYIRGAKPSLDVPIEEYSDDDSLIDILDGNLRDAGVSKEYATALARYLYAAYRASVPLLLAGPSGIYIAQALSCTISASLPAEMDCSCSYSVAEMQYLQSADDAFIIVRNPFSSDWSSHIQELLSSPGKYFIFLLPYAEDLTIEPGGILNYVMPLLTDVIISEPYSGALCCGKQSEQYTPTPLSGMRISYAALCRKLHIPELGITLIRNIFEMYHSFAPEDKSKDFDYLFGFLPCAYATGQRTALIDNVNAQEQLSKSIKNSVLAYLGEEDD